MLTSAKCAVILEREQKQKTEEKNKRKVEKRAEKKGKKLQRKKLKNKLVFQRAILKSWNWVFGQGCLSNAYSSFNKRNSFGAHDNW